MKNEYPNEFCLSESLSQALSTLVSKIGGVEYVCKLVSITIPKHRGMVFRSPLAGANPWGGGLKALSGAQIRVIDSEYGSYVEGIIEEETYNFFIVMESKSLEKFSKRSFKSVDDVYKELSSLCVLWSEYGGTFDSVALCRVFPYLREFFGDLNVWRDENERLTLDEDVLDMCIKKTLCNQHNNSKIKNTK